jgi:hypothetical protein
MHAPLVLVAAGTTAVVLLVQNAPVSSEPVGRPARHTRVDSATVCATHPSGWGAAGLTSLRTPQRAGPPLAVCAVVTSQQRARALERDPLR